MVSMTGLALELFQCTHSQECLHLTTLAHSLGLGFGWRWGTEEVTNLPVKVNPCLLGSSCTVQSAGFSQSRLESP